MKQILIFLAVFITFVNINANEVHQDFPKYRIPNYVTAEDMQSLIGQTYFYYPTISKFALIGDNTFLTGMFGDQPAFITFKSVEGKTKKGKLFNKMEIVVSIQPIETYKECPASHNKRFTYYSGEYNGKYSVRKNEFTYNELRLLDYAKWKSDNSHEIGRVFSDPMVKASYKIVDILLKNNYDRNDKLERLDLYYTLENSETGQLKTYLAKDAATSCFIEDKSGKYNTYLANVEKPANPDIKYGENSIVKLNDDTNTTKFSYIDNFINILIFTDSKQFYFTLKNISEYTQKVIWDEAVFVDYNGKTSKIMHKGVKYSQREESQPASTIIRGASIEEIACPTNNVYYNDANKDWETSSIYPSNDSQKDKQVQLMLPIQIKGVTNEYIFTFDLKYEYDNPSKLNL